MTFNDEAIQKSLTLVSELQTQSDRGAAIIGVAWLEEEMKEALQSFFEKDKKAWDSLFGRGRALGDLAPKIDLARLVGMCSKAIASDLHILRDVRNEFAHSVAARDDQPLNFETSHIKDKLLALKCIAHEEIHSPRHAFVRACAILNADFYLFRFMGLTVSSMGQIRAKAETGA